MSARQPVGVRWVGLSNHDIRRYLESEGDDAWESEVGGRRTKLAADRSLLPA